MSEGLFVFVLIVVMILVGGVCYMFAHCEPDWSGHEPPHFMNFLGGCGIGAGLLIALVAGSCVYALVSKTRPDLHVVATAKTSVERYMASVDSVQQIRTQANPDSIH